MSTHHNVIGIEAEKVLVFWMNHGYYSSTTFATLVEAVTYARGKGFSAAFHRAGEVLGSWDAITGVRIERKYDAEYYGHAYAQRGANWGDAR